MENPIRFEWGKHGKTMDCFEGKELCGTQFIFGWPLQDQFPVGIRFWVSMIVGKGLVGSVAGLVTVYGCLSLSLFFCCLLAVYIFPVGHNVHSSSKCSHTAHYAI